jgi:hypothetical protein
MTTDLAGVAQGLARIESKLAALEGYTPIAWLKRRARDVVEATAFLERDLAMLAGMDADEISPDVRDGR